MPDLSEHNNIMAEVMREKPELYKQLKDEKTALGVTLAKCIKTGVATPKCVNPGGGFKGAASAAHGRA